MIESHIYYSLFENIILGIQIFYISAHVVADIIRTFFIPDFLAESLKSNKN